MPLSMLDVLVSTLATIGEIADAKHNDEISDEVARVAMLAVVSMAERLVELNDEGP